MLTGKIFDHKNVIGNAERNKLKVRLINIVEARQWGKAGTFID